MRRLLTLLLSLLLATSAQAAMFNRDCSDPVVFRGAAVNALVLPWRVDGDSPRLQAASRQISSLAHLQLLMAMLPIGSVGAVDLLAERGAVCDVEQVLQRISRGGAESAGRGGTLAPGQAVLAIWGRLFEQDGELFVQTYLRFSRQGAGGQGLTPERIALSWGGAELQAGLPMQALAFAPRRISLADLARIDAACRDALRVRPTPDDRSPGVAFGASASQSFPYWITGSRGDWMQLEPMRPGLPAGWVRARAGEGQGDWSLARWLPELAYAEAVAGWLRLQVGGLPDVDQARLKQGVDTALARYEAAVPGDQAPAAWGLAAALRGHMAWTQGDRRAATALFAAAKERLPASAAASNLAAVSALSGVTGSPDSAQRLNRSLLGALALAPDDALLRGNLAALYRVYADKPGWSPFGAAELATRQQVLQAAP